ncbi:MAG: cytochrome c [Planctomycetes bacterium]|nr:cytochrome c [Planctomycetota bacterium]
MKHLRYILMLCFVASVVGAFLASATSDIEAQDTEAGKKIFESKCAACHTIGGGKVVGPDLEGLKDRAPSAEWVVSYVLNPQGVDDEYAKQMRKLAGTTMMQPLGISKKEAQDVVNFLYGGEGLETKSIEVATGDDAVALGLKYFTGEKSFENGAPSCISCHTVTVSGEMLFGGGSLASNVGSKYESLNHAWKRNGGDGMAAVIQNPQFLVMREVFAGKPLTDEEAGAITAFLGQVHKDNKGEEDSNTGMMFLFFILALLATGGVIFFFDRIWAKRFRDVRKPLVGEIE